MVSGHDAIRETGGLCKPVEMLSEHRIQPAGNEHVSRRARNHEGAAAEVGDGLRSDAASQEDGDLAAADFH